jgi:hypothetical protein
LLDAIGRTIDEVGKRLAATPESDRPGKVIFAILTDGEENSSRRFTKHQVFDMIRHQQEKYAWEFIFLAANQEAIATAAGIGIAADDGDVVFGRARDDISRVQDMSSMTSARRPGRFDEAVKGDD